jgi:hypothetical protein
MMAELIDARVKALDRVRWVAVVSPTAVDES